MVGLAYNSKTLSAQDRVAIHAHMMGMSKRAALMKAGFPPSMCKNHAAHFWGREDVIMELRKRMNDVTRKADVDAVKLIKMLMAIAELDVAELVDEDGSLRPVPEIQASIRKTLIVSANGREVKIKNSDRLKAIELIAKLLGLMEDKVQVSADAELMASLMAGRQRAALRNANQEGESDE